MIMSHPCDLVSIAMPLLAQYFLIAATNARWLPGISNLFERLRRQIATRN
jgi:hypothetical protein